MSEINKKRPLSRSQDHGCQQY